MAGRKRAERDGAAVGVRVARAGDDAGERVTCASVRPGRRTSRVAFAGEEPGADDPLLGFAPYVHSRPRRNSITPDRQRKFIAVLAASGIVTQAARAIGASMEALYHLRGRAGAEEFAQAWEAAIDRGMGRLEDCALERAIAGEERVIVQGGEVVATWRRYDTQLLMFLLRHRRSARYGAEDGFGRPASARERAMQDDMRRMMEGDGEEICASINAKLEAMRERMLAQRAAEAAGEAGAEEMDAEAVAAAEADATYERVKGFLKPEPVVAPGPVMLAPGVRLVPRLLDEGDGRLGLPRGPAVSRGQDVVAPHVLREVREMWHRGEMAPEIWRRYIDAGGAAVREDGAGEDGE